MQQFLKLQNFFHKTDDFVTAPVLEQKHRVKTSEEGSRKAHVYYLLLSPDNTTSLRRESNMAVTKNNIVQHYFLCDSHVHSTKTWDNFSSKYVVNYDVT
jgi:hypothetical protein